MLPQAWLAGCGLRQDPQSEEGTMAYAHKGNLLFLMMLCCLLPKVAAAQTTLKDVEIKAIDPSARTITVVRDGKEEQLDVSRKAAISVAGKEAELSSILPGDKATIDYHSDLAVVTKIEAKGLGADGWQFQDVFGKGVDPNRAFIVARDGSIVCQGSVNGFCLASLREFATGTFTIEFQMPGKDAKGSPYIAVASTLPNPKATDWTQQIPRGIEVKLRPDNLGELTLPTKEFKAELPLGQLRDDRRVVALRKADLKRGDWNTLEITCDDHQNVTVKINGTTVNAIAKAQSTKGHIIIFPNGEIRLRNAIMVAGETEAKLPFDEVLVKGP
jgi:hypothetical protein